MEISPEHKQAFNSAMQKHADITGIRGTHIRRHATKLFRAGKTEHAIKAIHTHLSVIKSKGNDEAHFDVRSPQAPVKKNVVVTPKKRPINQQGFKKPREDEIGQFDVRKKTLEQFLFGISAFEESYIPQAASVASNYMLQYRRKFQLMKAMRHLRGMTRRRGMKFRKVRNKYVYHR